MLRKSVIAAVTMTALLVVAGMSMAQQPQQGERMRQRMQQHRPMMGLNLTEEQQQKMADLHLALQKQIAPLRARLAVLRTDLKLLMTADSPDMSKIEAKQKEIGEVETQIRIAQSRHQLQVRAMLTPEQRKKFDAMILTPGQERRRMERAMQRQPRPARRGQPPMPR